MLSLDFTDFPVLISDKLILRKLRPDDLPEIFYLRSEENILQHIGKEPAKNINEARDFLVMIEKAINAAESIMWGITLKENRKKIIGTICLWNIVKNNYRAEIGYVLHPDFWRKGIMKEAVNMVLIYGFNEMKLHSIEARIKAENLASASLLQSAGFLKEGHLKEELFYRGSFYDSIIYSRFQ